MTIPNQTTESGKRRLLIRRGLVVTMDDSLGDLPTGDVLIVGDRIAEIGKRIDAVADEVIDATGRLVLPGLIDTHVHLWQVPLRGFTAPLWSKEYFQVVHPLASWIDAEAIGTAAELGSLEHVYRGATTVVDHCHALNSPEHVDASLEGYRAAGVRAILGFSLLEREGSSFQNRQHRIQVLVDLANRDLNLDSLQQIWMAVDSPFVENLSVAREHGLSAMIHANPMGLVSAVDKAGLLATNQLWVHGNLITDPELHRLAEIGAAISLTPDVEVGMGKPLNIFKRARTCRVDVVYGVDVPSYVRIDMLAQLRLALQINRALDGQQEREDGRVPPLRLPDIPQVASRELLASATSTAARSIGLGDVTGSLTPGKQADIIVVDVPFGLSVGDPAEHLLLHSESRDVDTVLVAGQVRKRDGRLLGVSQRSLVTRFETLRERVLGEDAESVFEQALRGIETNATSFVSPPFGTASMPSARPDESLT